MNATSPKPNVLSLQTPLLGHRTYGELLRGILGTSDRIAFTAHWADEERALHERSLAGRAVFRLAFTWSRDPRIRARNADFYALRYELGSSYWARRLLRRELGTIKPDVLHLHTQGLALLSTSAMRAIPTVISGDMTSRLTADQFTLPGWRWTHALHHALEAEVFRRAAVLAPFSAYAARSMIDAYGIDPERVIVIPPGVSLEAFGETGAHRAERNDPVRRILFIGGEFERKGGALLLEIFLRRFAEREDVELHLVTTSAPIIPKHPRIFVYRDVVPYSQKWLDLYERASVLVLPTFREAYGHVYLEAGAARLPAIGSTVGAGPEVVLDGITGFLAAPGDDVALQRHLETLVSNPLLGSTFGAAARRRVEIDFDAVRNAKRLEQVFIDLATATSI